MKTVTVGIIGCGAVAERCHLHALQTLGRVPRMRVVAISDINTARLVEIQKKFNLQEVFSTNNYHEVLEKPEIDAVLILTPPLLHATMVIDAIRAGKHVFCEKPFTLTVEEALEIVRAVDENKVKLMVGFNFRFIPHFVKMKKLIEKGTVGKLLRVATYFFAAAKEWPSVSGFQFKKDMGGGALFEMGCHHIDLLRWIIGEVKSVYATIWKSSQSITVDDNALACLEFANGATGSVNVSWSAPWLRRVEIFGEEGMIRVDRSKPYLELYLTGKSMFKRGLMKIAVKSVLDPYSSELNHFADCILKDKKPFIGAKDGLQTLKIVLDCYKSAEKGQRILVK